MDLKWPVSDISFLGAVIIMKVANDIASSLRIEYKYVFELVFFIQFILFWLPNVIGRYCFFGF